MEPFKRYLLPAAAMMCAFVVVLLRVFDPATSGIFPPCPVHYLTGWCCPGCGSLRALHQLLHGNLREAWSMNPLMILLLPFITYGLISELLLQLRGKGLPRIFLPAASIRALCVLIILFGIARNMPFHPLNLLAPGAMLRP